MAGRDLPDFVAEIELLPTEFGGRKSALPDGRWRTVLKQNDEHWSAMLEFKGGPVPGAVFDANVWLLRADLALPMFEVGKTFEVWEGGTTAWGRVKQMTGRPD
ncbi:hypothetical protein DyAD56_02150 [Dyella sp. AD56]|nr:hypothetical protein DyAD56_02150 [Dyella sp. AD56]